MALDSLSDVLPKWYSQSQRLQNNEILQDAEYKFPKKTPKFLGNLIQQFNVRSNQPTKGFKKWFDKINQYTNDRFVPSLEKNSMLLEKSCYKKNYILAEISNFNSLITYAQQHNKPVFSLTQADIKQSGAVWTGSKEKIASFKELFSNLANSIVRMTNAEC